LVAAKDNLLAGSKAARRVLELVEMMAASKAHLMAVPKESWKDRTRVVSLGEQLVLLRADVSV
jgi:hypothetical protein